MPDGAGCMLANSFSIFPGIGPATERRLWEAGVFGWRDFLEKGELQGISPARKAVLNGQVRRAETAYGSGDMVYFHRLLGQSGAWRLWDILAGDALCLDIETDGGPAGEGSLTVVGFYSRGEYRSYVRGVNLDRGSIETEFKRASLLVSYFGGGFDLPFLKAAYPGLELDIPHFDLCPAGHKVGLKGGLKKVERQVGIRRGEDVEGLDGYEAVLLWRAHQEGAPGALERLVSYNREDTVNLHALGCIIYERLREATGLPGILAAVLPDASPHIRPKSVAGQSG